MGGGGPCPPSVTKKCSNEDTPLIPYWYDEAGISLTKLVVVCQSKQILSNQSVSFFFFGIDLKKKQKREVACRSTGTLLKRYFIGLSHESD